MARLIRLAAVLRCAFCQAHATALVEGLAEPGDYPSLVAARAAGWTSLTPDLWVCPNCNGTRTTTKRQKERTT